MKSERRVALCVTRRFQVPPERVFQSWLDPDVARQWLFATASSPIARVAIDARVAGSFCFVDERPHGESCAYTGNYLAIVPHRRLAFTLTTEGRRRATTRVAVEIALRGKGCALTLSHENLPPDRAQQIRARWIGMLYGLGVTLDRDPSGR